MSDLENYGRLAESIFVIPTDEESFISWLGARARREAGIGIVPSLKHYHYSHLDDEPVLGIAGSKNFGIRRDVWSGGSWLRIPLVSTSVLSLSKRQDGAQCEVWVARLQGRGTIGNEPAEIIVWNVANDEYDRLVKDLLARWPNTTISVTDDRKAEWNAWNGQLPGKAPREHKNVQTPVEQEIAVQDILEIEIPILFLASDPKDASRLRLAEEQREIREKLRLSKLRDQFVFYSRVAVRPEDISQALLDIEPKIVHFSGHGTDTGMLCVENKVGEIQPVSANALAMLFEQFSEQIDCVILNACFSKVQANAIARHINCVIGMSQEIGDRAAISFAIGFYQAVGAGRTIKQAYRLGCAQINLQGIPENSIPVLVKR